MAEWVRGGFERLIGRRGLMILLGGLMEIPYRIKDAGPSSRRAFS